MTDGHVNNLAQIDAYYLQRAIELAERGRGLVEPNPLVGAIITLDNRPVSSGWHEKYGGPHAEVHALRRAGSKAKNSPLYVSLEPCCHHGKTPPCTQMIIDSEVKRVVVAMQDPFESVHGHGLELLRRSGIEVLTGAAHSASIQNAAYALNTPYLKLLKRSIPYVHAKWAMTLDGKIATTQRHSKWISGEASRNKAHQIRSRVDAIIVGSATVQNDDPLLTARPTAIRPATRIVLDSTAQISETSQLVRSADEHALLIATTSAAPAEKLAVLRDRNCECLILDTEKPAPDKELGREVSARPSIMALLTELGKRRMTNILVEGGAEILGSFFDHRQIDEAHIFLAPKLFGGSQALSALAGRGLDILSDTGPYRIEHFEPIEKDLYIRARKSFHETLGYPEPV